ncbi:MAG: hypothetical protein Q8873_05615 [Bacillota bacterium]|nr:hypothetical protein [Bacillota bacterium]
MKKFKYNVSSNDTLDDISRSVSAQARGMLKSDMDEYIKNNPKITDVDYRSGADTVDLNGSKTTPSGYDPLNMYKHTDNDGNIYAERETTPSQEKYVRETDTDGTSSLLSQKDFEKKIASQTINDKEKDELNRIVRVASPTQADYATSKDRSEKALKNFDENKYAIEETASQNGVPASLLSAMYFSKMAGDGSLDNEFNLNYVRASYKRVHGQDISWDDSTLSDYLKTPQGALDFMALCLKGEAEYQNIDLNSASSSQIYKILSAYSATNGKDETYASTVNAYKSVFKDIYQKIPDKTHDIKIV